MEPPDRHTMQLLVESRPWRAFAVTLYDRFVQFQHQLIGTQSDQRFIQGKIQELMHVLSEPYRIAGYRTPFEVISEAEIRQWMGNLDDFKADIGVEERIVELEATIVRAQAELATMKRPEASETVHPWETRRHSSPV